MPPELDSELKDEQEKVKELEVEVGIDQEDLSAEIEGKFLQSIKAVAELEVISEVLQTNLIGLEKDLKKMKNEHNTMVAGDQMAVQLNQTSVMEDDTSIESIKKYAQNETNKLKAQGCVGCLNKGNKYCFLRFNKR